MSENIRYAEPHRLEWTKCNCGSPVCTLQHPTNLGQFYQGTGFRPEERRVLDHAFTIRRLLCEEPIPTDLDLARTMVRESYGSRPLMATQIAQSLAEARQEGRDDVRPPRRWQHVRQGSTYEIFGTGVYQDNPATEGCVLSIVVDEHTGLWIVKKAYPKGPPNHASLQASEAVWPGALLVLYRGVVLPDVVPVTYARPVTEFYDGRFVPVSP